MSISWSYSSISVFKQCPKKYFHLRIAKDVVDESSIAATYGKEFHTAAELYVKDNVKLPSKFNFALPKLKEIEGNKGIKLPNGMYIKYDNIRNLKIGDGKEETVYDIKRGRTITATRLYGGKVIENVCQALARIVIGEQMLKVSKKYKVVMTVHDAITCIVKEEEVEEAKEFIGEVMRERPTWAIELPLDCEVGTGKNYGACS